MSTPEVNGEIPILDLDLVVVNNAEEAKKEIWESLGEELYEALHNVGFVYLVNHGISSDKIQNVFRESREFFHLPLATKKKYLIDAKESDYNGYTLPGQQILDESSKHEFRECFSVVEPYMDGGLAEEQQSQNRKLVGSLQELRDECGQLLRSILRLLGVALKLGNPEFFVEKFSRGNLLQDPKYNTSMMRTHLYPGIDLEGQVYKESVRCSEHTDFGILTLLFQDSVGGLEVQRRDGSWMDAKPIPGAIVMNTGDILEIWTNGVFPATLHRVPVPQCAEQLKKSRQSVTYFVNPDEDVLVEPVRCVSEEEERAEKRKYKPVEFSVHYAQKLGGSYKY